MQKVVPSFFHQNIFSVILKRLELQFAPSGLFSLYLCMRDTSVWGFTCVWHFTFELLTGSKDHQYIQKSYQHHLFFQILSTEAVSQLQKLDSSAVACYTLNYLKFLFTLLLLPRPLTALSPLETTCARHNLSARSGSSLDAWRRGSYFNQTLSKKCFRFLSNFY